MKTLGDVKSRITSQDWFHSIEITEDLVTPGRASQSYLQNMLTAINFPASFEGMSVLDIGAWDGFFSFEAEKRGAQRVVAYDLHPPDHYGFALAKELLNSKVEYIQGSIYDLSPDICGTFDVVLFFGVFYHLRYPLLALDRIWHVAKQYVLMETHCLDNSIIFDEGKATALANVDDRLNTTPIYQFYRRDELQPGDFSNWFAPNRQAVVDALGSAGFEPEFLATWDNRIAFKGTKRPGIPEYQQQTYEGLTWTVNADGSQSPTLPPRQTPEDTADIDVAAEIIAPLERPIHTFRQPAATDPQDADLLASPPHTGQEALAVVKAQLKESKTQLQAAQQTLRTVEQTRVYQLLRRFGRWKFINSAQRDTVTTATAHNAPASVLTTASAQPDPSPPPSSSFDAYYAQVREPKKRQGISYSPDTPNRIVKQLENLGVPVTDYTIDPADFARYFADARYREDYPTYYDFNITEKALEHYLASQLLQLSKADIYIDIASEHSPVPDIYHELFGSTTYRQDLAYEPGLNGDRIGGDASAMPLSDGFATKMALHCSLEHFEGNADRDFMREAARVLRPGGAICVVPLYLYEEYAIQTDPAISIPAGVQFDDGATIYCAQGWNNRFGRFYDPEQFFERIYSSPHGLHVDLYRLVNAQDVDTSCYAHFAMVLTKPEPPVNPS